MPWYFPHPKRCVYKRLVYSLIQNLSKESTARALGTVCDTWFEDHHKICLKGLELIKASEKATGEKRLACLKKSLTVWLTHLSSYSRRNLAV